MAFLFYALSDTLLNRKNLFDDKEPAIKNVEFLRLIFTFGVVVCHFAEKLEITTEGWLSVDFFFILSGFFLAVTFRPDRSTENFIKSKIIHFTPLLFLFALLSKPKIIPVLSNVFFAAKHRIIRRSRPRSKLVSGDFILGRFVLFLHDENLSRENKQACFRAFDILFVLYLSFLRMGRRFRSFSQHPSVARCGRNGIGVFCRSDLSEISGRGAKEKFSFFRHRKCFAVLLCGNCVFPAIMSG